MTRAFWTEPEIATLSDMWADNQTARTIGAVLRRSPSSVQKKAWSMGLTCDRAAYGRRIATGLRGRRFPDLPHELNRLFVIMWLRGRRTGEIAARVGLQDYQVGRYAARIGLIVDERVRKKLRQAYSLPPAGSCRYPIGEVDRPQFRFCREPAKEGSIYCTEHDFKCFERWGGQTTVDRPKPGGVLARLGSW